MATLRRIPSIDALLRLPRVRDLEDRHGHAAAVDALRDGAEALRITLSAGTEVADPAGFILDDAGRRLEQRSAPSLRAVINATGIVIHTNLGRAPLGRAIAGHVADIASSYTNLEFDLADGRRGRRDVHADALLTRLTGAESALVVNNAAAATLLVLAALARGREVVISRGELVEIGGGFRVPDVMAQSGARLREVGTTNRTRVADYAAAIGERTAAILRVHPSNFRVEGFTERPSVADLVGLGRTLGCPVIEDIGSGYIGHPDGVAALDAEPDVRDSIAAGVSIVIFSGDKLLGGPQAGIIAGERALLERIRTHPLLRALRVDRLTLAALEGTLLAHAAARTRDIPVARMLTLTAGDLDPRARRLASRCSAPLLRTEVIDGESAVGGGSAPGAVLPTRLVALTHESASADALALSLRRQDPPVVARILRDRVVLDLRTVDDGDDDRLAALVNRAAGAA